MSFKNIYIGRCISRFKNTAINRVAKYTTRPLLIFKAERQHSKLREKPKERNKHVTACLGNEAIS